jgi:hypothetical protein
MGTQKKKEKEKTQYEGFRQFLGGCPFAENGRIPGPIP